MDPSANMALYRHADMVRAIAGTCRVKFLSGLAGSQGKDALAEARWVGFAFHGLDHGCLWRPPKASVGWRKRLIRHSDFGENCIESAIRTRSGRNEHASQ
jgi:hypothetical protein